MRKNGRSALASSPVKLGEVSRIYLVGGYAKIPSFAVSVITKGRKSVALALEVTARDVIEKQRRLAVTAPSREQAALDGPLVVSQPREVVVEGSVSKVEMD
jgi:hypothetical protein